MGFAAMTSEQKKPEKTLFSKKIKKIQKSC